MGATSRPLQAPAAPGGAFEYVEGWGMAAGAHARVFRPRSADELASLFVAARERGVRLALRGGGNSYGDASVNSKGWVFDCTRFDRILGFDASSGRIEVEPGATIEKLWKFLLPRGFWPRVVSGTMFPTLGGALAANIHGKNNFAVGTIGDATLEFDLLAPNGERFTCNRAENSDLFHAAIGGFGQLGAFTRIVLETKRVHSGNLRVHGISCKNLREMMAVIEELKAASDYLVGWIDCFSGGDDSGRGLIHQAHYLEPGEDPAPERTLSVAHQELPANILGLIPKGEVWRALRLFNRPLGMRAINALKHVAGRLEGMREPMLQSHAGFAFLLDYVPNWKWAYGREPLQRGLIQYQPFVPKDAAHTVFQELLALCRRARTVPYLGVLKRHRPDPFWLTHAVDGWSLAMDFKVAPSTRQALWNLCRAMSEVVLAHGGRFYFAKDLVLESRDFERFMPREKREAFLALKQRLDPERCLESDLARRVGLGRA